MKEPSLRASDPMAGIEGVRRELVSHAVSVTSVRKELSLDWRPTHRPIVPAEDDALRPSAGWLALAGLDKNVGELGRHFRATHRTAACVSRLAHVDRPGDVRVTVPEQECDLVDALACK
jgi:hypothetical protein